MNNDDKLRHVAVVKPLFILPLFMSSLAFGAQIESLKVSVTGSDGRYVSTTKAVLKGDYERYVDRMLDGAAYPSMGVPKVKQVRLLGNNGVWIHLRVFFKDVQYYVKTAVDQKPQRTQLVVRLAPKLGPYPEQHDYISMVTTTTVQVIAGTPKDGTFTVNGVTRIVLKPEAIQFGLKGIMTSIAKGTVKALAK